ncbi:uncharacterized protein BJ212DRAFT_360415 [Suillus subaureus]|uniref:Uncharacterized protein n=1 Tax=Suillus subaureus TaxID=48587 RepID=A0A9P7JBZ5_9AGAM|nr:uncharacterized protein BJ212DRAFT_360415 [Suillus subaureus]KAG1814260.1 hypothetical protein BJ212DRAFT_360415 [Suillus subaureus]
MHAYALLRSPLLVATVALAHAMKCGQFTLPIFSFLISSLSVSASPSDGFFAEGVNSPSNERDISLRFSLSQPAIRPSSASMTLIYLFPSASIPSRHCFLMNHRTGVITHSLTSHSNTYHHRSFVFARQSVFMTGNWMRWIYVLLVAFVLISVYTNVDFARVAIDNVCHKVDLGAVLLVHVTTRPGLAESGAQEYNLKPRTRI